jgi:hypothetical protein
MRMRGIRPLHLALAVSAGLTCLMAGVLLGIVAGGGHVSHALSVIRGAPAPARAGVTAPHGSAGTVTVTVRPAGRGHRRATVTVTRSASTQTVTQAASTVTVTGPASTVTETVTETQTATQPGTTTAP